MAPEIPVLPVFLDLPGIRAFFTTRRGGESTGSFDSLNLGAYAGDDPAAVERNWARLLESQGLEGHGLALPRLCHGAAIAAVDGLRPDTPRESLSGVDAVYTRQPGWVLAVTMADCLPALIADPVTRCVAAVHAGWRGTRDEILGKTLSMLFAEGHCDPRSTRVMLGPCLSARSLEIGEDVASTLPAAHVVRENGRAWFDLRGANRAQALAAGVSPGNVAQNPLCTRENPHLFFSYRGEGGVTGRMAACIALA